MSNSNNTAEKKLIGSPSIDKPWLKYYSEEAINAPLPKCTIYGYLWENNKDNLDNVALLYFGKKITFRKLFENINQVAGAFLTIGVQPDDIVTICAVSIPETIYSFYGLNKIGAISNMVDPRTSVEGIKHYIEEVNSKVVMCIDAVFTKIMEAIKGTSVERVIVLDPADSLPHPKKLIYKIFKSPKLTASGLRQDWKNFIHNENKVAVDSVDYKRNQCCIIVHTGGTTGVTKGVMLTNDNFNCSAFQMSHYNLGLKRGRSWLNIMPPFIAYGLGNSVHNPLSCGMKVILIPQFDPQKFDELLLKYKPNHMVGVPSHYNNIINSKRLKNRDLSFIIAPIVGGDNLDTDYENTINDFFRKHNAGCSVIKGYGMTETSAGVCICSTDCNKIGSVGIPCSHITISSFDLNSGEELGFNQDGEICSTGPHTMLAYYNAPNETKGIIKIHDDGLAWVHSGDIGHIDEDGFVFIKGRIKRMIIRHDGFKVFPPLIESVVKKHSKIKLCCVVGVADQTYAQGQLPVVFFETSDINTKNLKQELADLCKKELPEYAQPVDYICVDKLPLTLIGKIDFVALEKMAESQNKG